MAMAGPAVVVGSGWGVETRVNRPLLGHMLDETNQMQS